MDTLPPDALWEISQHLGIIYKRCLYETSSQWHSIVHRNLPASGFYSQRGHWNRRRGTLLGERRAVESAVYHNYESLLVWLLQRGYPVNYRCWQIAARWHSHLMVILPWPSHAAATAIAHGDRWVLQLINKQCLLSPVKAHTGLSTFWSNVLKNVLTIQYAKGRRLERDISGRDLCMLAATMPDDTLELLLQWGIPAGTEVYEAAIRWQRPHNINVARRYGVKGRSPFTYNDATYYISEHKG